MEVATHTENEYLDLFATNAEIKEEPKPANFGAEEIDTNLFKEPAKQEPAKEEKLEEVNLLEEPKKETNPLEEVSNYFQDRLKSGKFVKITTEDEKGQEVEFIPKTPEDYDEVIDIQVNYKLDQAKKDLEQSWFSSKSAAFQAVSKYAELVDNPQDIIPFIQGIKTIESVSAINENEIEGAEKIVRTRLEQRGDSADIIDEQIDLLKNGDKLISTAQKYKPLILNEEKQYLSQMKKEAEQEQLQFNQIVSNIRTKAIEAIETPVFGKQKLKNEEKAVIYDLIAEPDSQSKGYKVYSAIDNLFEQGDFESLRLIALIAGGKKDSLVNYISAEAKNNTAADLQKKLRVATEARQTSSNFDSSEERVKIKRGEYNAAPRFGR